MFLSNSSCTWEFWLWVKNRNFTISVSTVWSNPHSLIMSKFNHELRLTFDLAGIDSAQSTKNEICCGLVWNKLQMYPGLYLDHLYQLEWPSWNFSEFVCTVSQPIQHSTNLSLIRIGTVHTFKGIITLGAEQFKLSIHILVKTSQILEALKAK